MAYPRVGGHPDYTTDGASRFIPEIWSGKLIKKFYDATVLSSITNTDYEGEIKNHGDTVIIRQPSTVTIRNYSKGMTLTTERPESTALELLIDKGKYWSTVLDKVDKVQSDIGLLEMWSQDAAEQMKITIDEDVLDNIYDDSASTNAGTTAGRISGNLNLGSFSGSAGQAVTKTNVIDHIVNMGQALDENNVPESDRFIVIPAWMASKIKTSDLKDASLTGDGKSTLRNGRLGMIDRFTLYSSNLLYSATDGTRTCYAIMFGTKYATTFATQIVATESLKAESTFGEIIRGLQVYGYKVVKPECLGTFVGYPA